MKNSFFDIGDFKFTITVTILFIILTFIIISISALQLNVQLIAFLLGFMTPKLLLIFPVVFAVHYLSKKSISKKTIFNICYLYIVLYNFAGDIYQLAIA